MPRVPVRGFGPVGCLAAVGVIVVGLLLLKLVLPLLIVLAVLAVLARVFGLWK